MFVLHSQLVICTFFGDCIIFEDRLAEIQLFEENMKFEPKYILLEGWEEEDQRLFLQSVVVSEMSVTDNQLIIT